MPASRGDDEMYTGLLGRGDRGKTARGDAGLLIEEGSVHVDGYKSHRILAGLLNGGPDGTYLDHLHILSFSPHLYSYVLDEMPFTGN